MLPNSVDQLRDHFQHLAEAAHACIRDSSLAQLQVLLSALPPVVDLGHSHPEFGTPLHFAAACGDLEAVELLLHAGADPLLTSRRRRLRPPG